MPWEKAQLIELRDDVTPGYWGGNLYRDGRGRLGFGSGRSVYLTSKSLKPFSTADETMIKARDQVTSVTFQCAGEKEPTLFVASETSPPTIEVFREGKDGLMKKISEKILEQAFADAVVTSMTIAAAALSPLLAIGMSTGGILLFNLENDRLDKICAISDLKAAVCCLSGDLSFHRGLLAAADADGNVKVWREKATPIWQEIYSLKLQNDFATALAIRGAHLFVGQFSGIFVVHDLDEGRLIADIVTNTRWISAIDAHPAEPMVVVAGEDCRASILVLPSAGEVQLKLIFSVCVNGAITGAVFTCSRSNRPDISLAIFERSYLVQYNFTE